VPGGPAPIDALNEADKDKIRYHLGYLSTSSAASIQMGIPKPVQTVFLLESAMGLLTNGYAVERVRHIIEKLDLLECKLFKGADALNAERLGEMTLHPLRGQGKLFTDSLEGEYRRWAGRLADILGVPFYPYSTRFRRGGPGTNVPVR
jgi:hypothetical protein